MTNCFARAHGEGIMVNCFMISRDGTSLLSRLFRGDFIACGLILVVFGAPRELKGAQLTIHVSATISQLDGDASIVPLTLAVGDAIATEYSFPVADFTSSATTQPGSQKLILGNTVLQSDNSAGLALNEGLLVPPDDPSDTLLTTCVSLTDVFPSCSPNRFPSNQNLIWDPKVILYGDPGSLQTLADVSALSNLSSIHGSGTLLINIFKLNEAPISAERLLTIRATITELSAIPEPAGLLIAILAVALLGCLNVRFRFCTP